MKRSAFMAFLLQSLLIAFGLSAEQPDFMERLHLWDRELNWTNRSDPLAPQRIMLEIPTYMSTLEPRIDSGDEDAAAAWVAARQLGMRLSGVPPGDKNRLLSAIELIRAKADRGGPIV